MKNYTCPRCGFTNNIKTKYIYHLNRKNICKPLISKTNLQKEYIKYGINEKIKMNPKESLTESKIGFMNPNESKRIHFCKYCEKFIQQIVICVSIIKYVRKRKKQMKQVIIWKS